MRQPLVAFLVPLLVVAFATFAPRATRAGDAPAKPLKLMNDHCPVTGEEVNPELSQVWNGLEIRFCCEGCIPGFLADPAKYMPTLLKDLVAQRDAARKSVSDAAKASLAPAVSAGPVPAVPSVAPSPVSPQPAPARVLPTVPATAVALTDIGNAMCPISTRPVKAGIYVDYHAMRVRLCCKGCIGGFNADPAKSLTWLRQDPAVAARIDAAEAVWAANPRPPAPAAPLPAPVMAPSATK